MDTNNPYEVMKSRWLSGRGTKVLYAAVVLGIIGALGTGQSLSAAQDSAKAAAVEQQIAATNAKRLAEDMGKACSDSAFLKTHADVCRRAEQIAVDPSKAPSQGATGGLQYGGAAGGTTLETLGIAP